MTDFTEEQLERIRRILVGVRVGGVDRLDLKKADVELLAKRIEELDDGTLMIGEFAPWALRRMKEELQSNKKWIQECVEQARIAELVTLETQHMVTALQALVDGGMYASGDEINVRWGNIEADYIERGLYPDAETPDPPPEPQKVEVPPPVVSAPSVAAAKPPAPKPAPPVAKPAPKAEPAPPPVDDLAERIMALLDEMIVAHGQDLNAMRVAERLHEPHERVRVSLRELEADGLLQLVKRPDKNMYAILRPGEALENTSGLSDNQVALFGALVSVAGADWQAQISRGRLKEMTGINPGSLDQILWALEKKDRIRILDRGNSTTPTKFLICEAWRPERPAPPKTDAELIAEALAAGKVTPCPPAHVH